MPEGRACGGLVGPLPHIFPEPTNPNACATSEKPMQFKRHTAFFSVPL